MKRIRRILLLTLALCLLFAGGGSPFMAGEAKAEALYDAQAAVNYAVAHWNDGVGVCDQFVKACLRAGGINITVGTVDNVRAALLKYGTEYTVKFRGSVCYQQDNPNIAVGDIIFYYCSKCGNYPHTAIITKKDNNGVFYFSQHNGALLNLKFTTGFHDSHGHRDPNITYKVVHIPPKSADPAVVSFNLHPSDLFATNVVFSKQCFTVTRGGVSIEPDNSFITLYNSDGSLLGSMYLENYYYTSSTSGLVLTPDTEYSAEAHVIVDGVDHISQRVTFKTQAELPGWTSFGFDGLEETEFGVKWDLLLIAFYAEPYRDVFESYGLDFYDTDGNLVYRQTYRHGVNEPGNVVYYYEDAQGFYIYSYPPGKARMYCIELRDFNSETDLPGCILQSGTTYRVIPFLVIEGEMYQSVEEIQHPPGFSFTTLSRTPDQLSNNVNIASPTATSCSISGFIKGSRSDGQVCRSPHTIRLNVTSVESGYISNAENTYVTHTANGIIETFSFDLSLSPGQAYDTTFEALWDDYTYTFNGDTIYTDTRLTYDANGGSNAPEGEIKPYGGTIVLSGDVPVRIGYDFLGWAMTADATVPQYKPGASFAEDGDITLYAVWAALEPDLVLPADLEQIGSESFVGGTFTYVLVPEGVTVVESRAFADCPNLQHIRFLGSDTNITADAFGSDRSVVIHAPKNSYAEFYANKYGFTFVAE